MLSTVLAKPQDGKKKGSMGRQMAIKSSIDGVVSQTNNGNNDDQAKQPDASKDVSTGSRVESVSDSGNPMKNGPEEFFKKHFNRQNIKDKLNTAREKMFSMAGNLKNSKGSSTNDKTSMDVESDMLPRMPSSSMIQNQRASPKVSFPKVEDTQSEGGMQSNPFAKLGKMFNRRGGTDSGSNSKLPMNVQIPVRSSQSSGDNFKTKIMSGSETLFSNQKSVMSPKDKNMKEEPKLVVESDDKKTLTPESKPINNNGEDKKANNDKPNQNPVEDDTTD
jgi:hypothetical protein